MARRKVQVGRWTVLSCQVGRGEYELFRSLATEKGTTVNDVLKRLVRAELSRALRRTAPAVAR